MTTFTVTKDPDAVLDYAMSWATWLGADTISTSVWSVDGPDSSLTVDSDSETTTVATVWLSGGTPNMDYVITNRITTAGSRTDDRSITVQVRER